MTRIDPLSRLTPAVKRAALAELTRRSFDALMRRAFAELHAGATLTRSWHHDAIAHHLQEVVAGRCRRLLITMPPRSLKSHMISVAFPAWILGQDPSLRLICTSYSEDLAVSLGNQWRQVMEADWYRDAFPDVRLSSKKNAEGEAHVRAGGYRLSHSALGSLTGRGADIIIVDDPMKAQDAHCKPLRDKLCSWFDQTLVSRLNNKADGAIIVVMQRLHPDDLAGHLLAKEGWTHLNLPAAAPADVAVPIGRNRLHHWARGDPLQPKREPQEVLARLRHDMGSRAYAAQYLQQPVPDEGGVIRLAWFARDLKGLDLDYGRAKIVVSIDAASSIAETADYSVLQVWPVYDERVYHLIGSHRGQWGYPDLKARTLEVLKQTACNSVLVEAASSGIALHQDLRSEGIFAKPIKPGASKRQRLEQVLPLIEKGQVVLPKSAIWLEEFEAEIAAFPAGRNDDQIDAMSQLLLWDQQRRRFPKSLPQMRIG